MFNLASASANWRRLVGIMERGMPSKCRCGAPSVIKTSNTFENPGRLFHCCLHGSEKDPNHLFKWTDESVVEEIEGIKEMVGDMKSELKDDVKSLEFDTRTCEAVVGSYEKNRLSWICPVD